jgi:hypothetical protein
MKRCDWAGAGMVLFFWIIAFAIAGAFERELREYGGFLMLILGVTGIWAGYEVRNQCAARAAATRKIASPRDDTSPPT